MKLGAKAFYLLRVIAFYIKELLPFEKIDIEDLKARYLKNILNYGDGNWFAVRFRMMS